MKNLYLQGLSAFCMNVEKPSLIEECHTVKPVLSGHSKIDKTKILMTDGSLMMVESIAECSLWSILQIF